MAVADAGPDLYEIPVKALQPSTKGHISSSLNPVKVIPTDEGLPRDWRGLAQLTDLRADETSMVAANADPTAQVLSLWKDGTIGQLKDFLGELDRWDIVDDTVEMMEKDAVQYKESVERARTSAKVLDEEVDKHILTKDDVTRLDQGLNPQHYNAYLLYADEDEKFAMMIVTEMEKKYDLKLCFRDRDLIGGHMFEHEVIMRLISERCNRMIVVFSPSFFKSEANKFFVSYAQALGIDQRRRKVIPVMYERCTVPSELSYYYPLDYSRSGHLWDFWEKLNDSIQTPKVQTRERCSSAMYSTTDSKPIKISEKKPECHSAPILLEYDTDKVSGCKLPMYKEPTKPLILNNPPAVKKSVPGYLGNIKGKAVKWINGNVFNNTRKGKKPVEAQ